MYPSVLSACESAFAIYVPIPFLWRLFNTIKSPMKAVRLSGYRSIRSRTAIRESPSKMPIKYLSAAYFAGGKAAKSSFTVLLFGFGGQCLKYSVFSEYKFRMPGISASVSFRALYGVKILSKFIMCLSCYAFLDASDAGTPAVLTA